MYAALARGVDSLIRSLWSALALTGQRGLTVWLNWNIIQEVIVCDMQMSERKQTDLLYVVAHLFKMQCSMQKATISTVSSKTSVKVFSQTSVN